MEVRSAGRCEWEPPLCATCLSSGRRLTALGELRRTFLILMESDPRAQLEDLAICWECAAVLRRTSRFRLQASRALACLQTATIDVKSSSSLHPGGPTVRVDIPSKSASCESDREMPQEIEVKTPKTEYESDGIETDKLASLEYTDEEPEIKPTPHLEVLSADGTKFKRARCRGRFVKKTKTVTTSDILKCRSRIMRPIELTESEVWDHREQTRNTLSFKAAKYKCDKCILQLHQHNYSKHMESAHGLPSYKYECRFCTIRFKTKILFEKHIRNHFRVYCCLKCSFTCERMEKMYHHYNMAHRLKKSYSCSICDLKLYDRFEYLEHLKMHRMEDKNKIYQCDHCGKQYKSRLRIESHLTTHAGKSYECDVCASTFTAKKNILRHVKYHHDITPEPSRMYCVECDKQFTTILSYRHHINTVMAHAKSKPINFPCTACEKTFRRKGSLKKHYDYIHLQKILFPCNICNKNYGSKPGMQGHIKRFHQQVPHPKVKMCTICGRGFSTNRVLMHHIRTHTGERPYKCDMCDAAFAQKTPLIYHVKRIHLGVGKATTASSSD